MNEEERERTRLFLLRAGVPDPTLGLVTQAKKSPQSVPHLRFLEKRQSYSSPRGQPGAWRPGEWTHQEMVLGSQPQPDTSGSSGQ